MKGQRLFLRRSEASDLEPLRTFLERDGYSLPPRPGPMSQGLMAKLVGNIVAYSAFAVSTGALEIQCLYVAVDIRGKRVGRGILAEIERIAEIEGCDRIVAAATSPVGEFLLHEGFARDGNLLAKPVSRKTAGGV